MTQERQNCQHGGATKPNGNCTIPGPDGLPVQCVGEWAHHDKHTYLSRYIHATRQARQRYLVPGDHGPPGGAGFIDLFGGPGKVRIRDSGEIHDGSPLIAVAHREAPFSKIVVCDLEPENAAALNSRTRAESARVEVVECDSNARAEELVQRLPRLGLNLALIDPFKLDPLRFTTIEHLARCPRMDLIVNFPTQDATRNIGRLLDKDNDVLAEALGTDSWRSRVRDPSAAAVILVNIFVEQLERLGYTGKRNRSISVKNSKNAELYRLVFASKNPLGDKIWDDITTTTSSGQRGFGF